MPFGHFYIRAIWILFFSPVHVSCYFGWKTVENQHLLWVWIEFLLVEKWRKEKTSCIILSALQRQRLEWIDKLTGIWEGRTLPQTKNTVLGLQSGVARDMLDSTIGGRTCILTDMSCDFPAGIDCQDKIHGTGSCYSLLMAASHQRNF